jgi:hypothetical protein
MYLRFTYTFVTHFKIASAPHCILTNVGNIKTKAKMPVL